MAAVATVLALVVAGCGDDTKSTTPKPQSKRVEGLTKPIKPRCGVGRFRPPTVQQSVRDGVRSWTLSYAIPPTAPKISGQTTSMTLVEFARPKAGRPKGRLNATIAGRRVSLRPRSSTTPAFVASWVTDRAGYVMIDNGRTTESLRRVIACLP